MKSWLLDRVAGMIFCHAVGLRAFATLPSKVRIASEAESLIEQLGDYNTKHPHSALGSRPPVPEIIVPIDSRKVMHQHSNRTIQVGPTDRIQQPTESEAPGWKTSAIQRDCLEAILAFQHRVKMLFELLIVVHIED